MKNKQFLTTTRAVQIFDEMVERRRGFCGDKEFVRMDWVWEELCPDEGTWRIRTYRSRETEGYRRKAGVVQINHDLTLIVDERLFGAAKKGEGLPNFILAHELTHVALDHHAESVGLKHFQLFQSANGMMSIKPPTVVEQEADLGGVIFQCGIALLDERLTDVDLAKKAFTDLSMVKKARRFVRLDVFKRELQRQQQLKSSKVKYPRVIL